MKPFNLKEYLKNPSREVVTRDGKPVRIICTDAVRKTHPIVALVKSGNEDLVQCYMPNGKLYKNTESTVDLFFAPIKCEGWVNLYDTRINGKRCMSSIFDTKEEAVKNIGLIDTGRFDLFPDYISTIHIEWEEDE